MALFTKKASKGLGQVTVLLYSHVFLVIPTNTTCRKGEKVPSSSEAFFHVDSISNCEKGGGWSVSAAPGHIKIPALFTILLPS